MSHIDLNPLVSIIIPTYNRANIIAKTLESAINQTYTNKQIIVVDDGSTDHTRQLIRDYPQVEYIYQERGGPGKARNTGLKHAHGVYIASLDSDDEWSYDFLEHCAAKLKNSELDFVFTGWVQSTGKGLGYDFFLRTGMVSKYIKSNITDWEELDSKELRSMFINACPSPSSSLLIRRDSMVNGWNENLNIADDWCLLLDMVLSKNCTAAFTTKCLWLKKLDGKNIYDGRSIAEVHMLLWVNDSKQLVQRYKSLLTSAEVKKIKIKSAIFAIVCLKKSLRQSKGISESLQLLKLEMSLQPLMLLKGLLILTKNKIIKKASSNAQIRADNAEWINIDGFRELNKLSVNN